MTSKEILHKYKIWVLRKEYLKGFVGYGCLYDADIKEADKNIVKLENLILRRMIRGREKFKEWK